MGNFHGGGGRDEGAARRLEPHVCENIDARSRGFPTYASPCQPDSASTSSPLAIDIRSAQIPEASGHSQRKHGDVQQALTEDRPGYAFASATVAGSFSLRASPGNGHQKVKQDAVIFIQSMRV